MSSRPVELTDDDRRVLHSMPGTARQLAERTGLPPTRVGGCLSRLKRAREARRRNGVWYRR